MYGRKMQCARPRVQRTTKRHGHPEGGAAATTCRVEHQLERAALAALLQKRPQVSAGAPRDEERQQFDHQHHTEREGEARPPAPVLFPRLVRLVNQRVLRDPQRAAPEESRERRRAVASEQERQSRDEAARPHPSRRSIGTFTVRGDGGHTGAIWQVCGQCAGGLCGVHGERGAGGASSWQRVGAGRRAHPLNTLCSSSTSAVPSTAPR